MASREAAGGGLIAVLRLARGRGGGLEEGRQGGAQLRPGVGGPLGGEKEVVSVGLRAPGAGIPATVMPEHPPLVPGVQRPPLGLGEQLVEVGRVGGDETGRLRVREAGQQDRGGEAQMRSHSLMKVGSCASCSLNM